jgi:predicted esterase
MPGKVPNLVTKNIFMGAGKHDPRVPREQTERLFRLFKKAGAKVVLRWEELRVIYWVMMKSWRQKNGYQI